MGGSDDNETSVQRQCDWSTATPSTTAINVIAAIEDIDPVALSEQLETTLFDHVDPEALDTLLATSADIEISFALEEYTVRLDEGTVAVSHR
ncbi:HalOD1 output domain-containing protein [Natronorubrum sp. DTA28]|uniref:HalOD1 output domain-containing protein n=1 Tax=Natronorubrum sp. DTA28 TaxID=3447019 RepID=UPI003F8614E2